MNDNIHFSDDYQPSIREQAGDLAEMALERIDNEHGVTLAQLLDQLATYISDRAAADLVAETCERRYQTGC